MKKLESKKFMIVLLVIGILTLLIIMSFILSNSTKIADKVYGFVSMAQSIGLVLAGGIVTYFIGQSYIDGRKEYKNIVKIDDNK